VPLHANSESLFRKSPMKRTKATKSDTLYVTQNPENLSPEDLSKELGLRLSVIQDILEQKPKSVGTVKPVSQFSKNMITSTERGRKGVAVMTQGASEVIDETRVTKKKDTSSFITTVK
jgi:hypothetical protein